MSIAATPEIVRMDEAANRVTLATTSMPAGLGPALLAFHFGGGATVTHRGGTVEIGVPMPVLDGEPWVERWHTPNPARITEHADMTTATAGGLRLAAMALAQQPHESMAALGRRAYGRLLEALGADGWHLLRFWNFLPRINAEEAGLERYRRFSLGRYQALASGAGIGATGFPAASALGGDGLHTVVLGLATREAPLHLENPRQISAYRYPRRYGPRSPSFARASWLASGNGGLLLVSGTASIVGHESRHHGNAAAQTTETVANLRHLLGHARDRTGQQLALAPDQAVLRVYLRHPADLPRVQRQLASEGLGSVPAVFLRADICRRELVMEIEGVISAPAPASAT